VIVTKNVKRAVDYEAQQLLSSRYVLSVGVFPRNLSANVDIPHYGAAFPNPAESERNHVGRSMVPEVAMVQL
jgi:hypothetical protein